MVNSVRRPWVPTVVRGLQGAPECFTDVCVPHVSKNVDEQTIGVKSFRTARWLCGHFVSQVSVGDVAKCFDNIRVVETVQVSRGN